MTTVHVNRLYILHVDRDARSLFCVCVFLLHRKDVRALSVSMSQFKQRFSENAMLFIESVFTCGSYDPQRFIGRLMKGSFYLRSLLVRSVGCHQIEAHSMKLAALINLIDAFDISIAQGTI